MAKKNGLFLTEKTDLYNKLKTISECMEKLEESTDELNTNIINEREGVSDSSKRGIALDDFYLLVDNIRGIIKTPEFEKVMKLINENIELIEVDIPL